MKPYSVKRFDAEKAIKYCSEEMFKGRMLFAGVYEALFAGLVPDSPDPEDTISISRAVAEEWLNQVMDIYDQCGNVDKPMVKSIRKALSEGRV